MASQYAPRTYPAMVEALQSVGFIEEGPMVDPYGEAIHLILTFLDGILDSDAGDAMSDFENNVLQNIRATARNN